MSIYPFVLNEFDGTNIFLDCYRWDEQGFCIIYLDDVPSKAKSQAAVIFKPDVLSIRITHASQSWKIEERMDSFRSQLPAGAIPYPCMFVMAQSEYIDWYRDTETIDNIHRLASLKHFSLFVDDTLIEIIDDRNPEIAVSVL